MEPIKNILVPVDLSDFSVPILKMSKAISQPLNAEIHVVNIVEERLLTAFKEVGKGYQEFIDRSEDLMEQLVEESEVDKTKHTSEVILGVPFMEIINKSEGLPKTDLIVLGGMPSNELNNLGKNAFKIVRFAPFHTLTVRTKEKNQKVKSIPVKTITVALDFSENSLMALDYALLLKPVFGAKVCVQHVVGEKDVTNGDDITAKLRNHLSSDKFEAIDDIKVFKSDNISRELIKQTAATDTDLLIVGSHSRRGFLRNLFLGKVAYDVVRKANCSVLVLKEPLKI